MVAAEGNGAEEGRKRGAMQKEESDAKEVLAVHTEGEDGKEEEESGKEEEESGKEEEEGKRGLLV